MAPWRRRSATSAAVTSVAPPRRHSSYHRTAGVRDAFVYILFGAGNRPPLDRRSAWIRIPWSTLTSYTNSKLGVRLVLSSSLLSRCK
jgi:hypothetical protein